MFDFLKLCFTLGFMNAMLTADKPTLRFYILKRGSIKMAEQKNKRRTKEQMIADLDAKIAYHDKCITSLKAKKEEILNPALNPKAQLKAVLDKASENGITPAEIAKKLGITL